MRCEMSEKLREKLAMLGSILGSIADELRVTVPGSR